MKNIKGFFTIFYLLFIFTVIFRLLLLFYNGFAVETVNKHRKRGVRKSKCIRFEIYDQSYDNIRQMIHEIEQERNTYKYTRLGVLCCILHIPFHANKCSAKGWRYRNLCKTARNRCGFVLFLYFVVVYIVKREVRAVAE